VDATPSSPIRKRCGRCSAISSSRISAALQRGADPAGADRARGRGKREFALVRWGLIPPWVKDPRAFSLLINARGESVNEKPAFKNAMKRRRCLFPADGFYEWKREGDRKRPYFVRLKSGQPMAFAGLWESWMGPNGEEMETAAIVTTVASRSIAHIHDRMPVIVAPEAFDFWLDPNVDGEMAVCSDRADAGCAAGCL
jgi:putative SOS response-associated peptidase YedK